MPELDDAAFERRLRGVLKEHLGALPLDLTVDDLDRRREAMGVSRGFGRGRGITLLAAAALLLVGGAVAAGSGILRWPSLVPPVPEPSVIAVATPAPDGTFPSPSELAAPSASSIPVAGPEGVWIPTGSMVMPRRSPAAVRLLDGRVLLVGGASDDDLTSADLYDPATGTWSAAAKMTGVGENATFTMLRDGRVLAVGGDGAEVYDPASGTWTATPRRVEGPDLLCYGAGEACAGFGRHHATLLDDSTVLVTTAGGAQLYDPDNGTWTATGKMNVSRLYGDAAILLSDGKVLVAGGRVEGELNVGDLPSTNTAEVYDPVTGSWTEMADMQASHVFWPAGDAMASQLPDGKVLVYHSAAGSEVYDPTTGTWTARALPTELRPDIWALLSDGTLLTEGTDEQPEGTDPGSCSAAIFDPRTGSLTTTSSMLRCSADSSFTLLLDGTVLKAGGHDCNDQGQCILNGAAELYVPAGVRMPPLPAFPSPPPFVLPSPTPVPPLLPPAAGAVPPNARSWTVTVDNQSSEPATMFVADGDDGGTFRLVGSATPNVIAAGASAKVTFLFPAEGVPDAGWITVNPRVGDGADVGFLGANDIGKPGKIMVRAEGDWVWVGPAQ
jgi:hypothetical protein